MRSQVEAYVYTAHRSNGLRASAGGRGRTTWFGRRWRRDCWDVVRGRCGRAHGCYRRVRFSRDTSSTATAGKQHGGRIGIENSLEGVQKIFPISIVSSVTSQAI
jgi:hypothetical protein